MKELFQLIEKMDADKMKSNKFKMITEPGEDLDFKSYEKPRDITLLQN